MTQEGAFRNMMISSIICAGIGFGSGIQFAQLLSHPKEQPKPKIYHPTHTYLFIPNEQKGITQ